MKGLRSFGTFGLWLGALLLAGVLPAAKEVTHPLITPYPGSTQSRSQQAEFDAYKLVTGVEDGSPVGMELEGKVTRMGYYHPRERSILEIFRNYESALVEAGMEVVFACAGTECGSRSWSGFNGITTKSGADCRYVAGKIGHGDATAYIAIMIGKHRHSIDIVEIQEMETGMVTVDADALARGIERDGRVAVYGIYFDTGKATLKSDSKPALDEIARLMEQMPDLKIFVVGHTDGTGGFEMNMNLSQERARAVVKELIAAYGIDESRLAGHGVGPLSPASTNRNDQGREKNRRVELVEQ